MGAQDQFPGERLIDTYFPSPTNSLNHLAAGLPWILGGPIFFVSYILKALVYGLDIFLRIVTLGAVNFRGNVRYSLTNRRVRVERGPERQIIDYVLLEDISDARQKDVLRFTRTGDLEILRGGEPALTLVGIREPWCVRQTILDAVNSRVKIQEILRKERETAPVTASA